MGHSASRSHPLRRRGSIGKMSNPQGPRSPASTSNKSLPTYIVDSLRDPVLLSDNWYALAELEDLRQEAGKESLLRTSYAKPPEIARYSITQSALRENKAKNRYQNVAPYDLNAVRVGDDQEVARGGGMYLNASWVRERAGGALWIASQAPLPHTQYEFLALCTDITPVHRRVRTIVQLTPWVEKRFQAAHPYIPNEIGESIVIDRVSGPSSSSNNQKSSLKVTVKAKRHVTEADCIVRAIEIRYNDWPDSPVFEVRHLAFDSWADHGVPKTASTAYWLALLADEENRRGEDGQNAAPPPMVVHCSAGVGRTGTFIAICSLLRAFGFLPSAVRPEWDTYTPVQTGLGPYPEALPPDDQVVQEVDALREQRIMMVQMPEQFSFIYELLSLALSKKIEGQ